MILNLDILDEGQEIVKINGKSSVNGGYIQEYMSYPAVFKLTYFIKLMMNFSTGSTCKFGDRGVPFGHGFKTKTKTKSYGSEISLVCECSMPPLLICKEEIWNGFWLFTHTYKYLRMNILYEYIRIQWQKCIQ